MKSLSIFVPGTIDGSVVFHRLAFSKSISETHLYFETLHVDSTGGLNPLGV